MLTRLLCARSPAPQYIPCAPSASSSFNRLPDAPGADIAYDVTSCRLVQHDSQVPPIAPPDDAIFMICVRWRAVWPTFK